MWLVLGTVAVMTAAVVVKIRRINRLPLKGRHHSKSVEFTGKHHRK